MTSLRAPSSVCRRWFAIAVGWSCAATLIGCPSRREGARDASTVTILYPYGDERIAGPMWADEARFLAFLPLAGTNERGEPQGRLAQRWSHSGK